MATFQTVQLSEAGYQQLAVSKDTNQMAQYIRRLLAFGLATVTNVGGLNGFAVWYSGEKATQSLANLIAELDMALWVEWGNKDDSMQRLLTLVPGLCLVCTGNAYVHKGNMPHDKGNERCFFCEDCSDCESTGKAPPTATAADVIWGAAFSFDGNDAPPAIVRKNPCAGCSGKGFVHTSGMAHDSVEGHRCFFCSDCELCAGSGVGTCAGCNGRGFGHGVGGMPHEGPLEVKCFFCETCEVCDAATQCEQCDGKGWQHKGSIPHDTADDAKCFFCEDCVVCSGTGKPA